MFYQYSGRLCYAARRIMYIFSYMNNFGVRVRGREDNSGDLIITYSDDDIEVNLISN